MTFALVMCGPPCSLFIFLSSSQHLRHLYGAMGSPWDVPTQLANIIAGNMACFLHIIKIARKPWIVVEQPKGSWLLKLPRVLDLISTCKFMRVSTYMCFWDLRRFVSICFEIQILLYFGFFCMITMITMSVAVWAWLFLDVWGLGFPESLRATNLRKPLRWWVTFQVWRVWNALLPRRSGNTTRRFGPRRTSLQCTLWLSVEFMARAIWPHPLCIPRAFVPPWQSYGLEILENTKDTKVCQAHTEWAFWASFSKMINMWHNCL